MTNCTSPVRRVALCLMLCLAASAFAQQPSRYGIKSATISYLVTISVGGTKVEHKQVLMFDEFGARQREDIYTGDVLTESTIDNGTSVFKIMYATKEAYDLGALKNLIDYTCDWNSIPDTFKVAGYARELPPSPVAGRVCACFQASGNVQGGITTFASWNRLALLRDAQSDKSSKVLRATAVDETTPVPASTFDIPAGFRIVRP